MKISYVQHFKNSMKVIASINLNASGVRIIKASIYSDVLHELLSQNMTYNLFLSSCQGFIM